MSWPRNLVETVASYSYNNKNEYDAERGQAISRVITVPLIFLYMVIALFASSRELNTVIVVMLIYSTLYIPGSWLLLHDIVKRPGYKFGRRVFAMSNDYLAMTFAMAVGGAITAPIFAMVLWVTVGNGLRYGPRYLAAATAFALLSLAAITYFNSFWREQPYIVVTFVMTALLVPAYVYVLLNRLHKAYNSALEANLAKSRFLAQASHDLRQPIHAISLFIACLRDARLGVEERQMVNNIDRSLQSVSRLFQSLLDISTLDSGKITAHPEDIAIGGILHDIAQQNSEAAQWAGVELKVVTTRKFVRTDPSLLTTMIQNIVSNALKYAPGSPVLMGTRIRNGKLSIEVHDRGPGIAGEHLPRLFEEFYQVRERGDKDTEGVGLGLSIVQRLAGLMDLDVSLRSVEGQGTTVVIDGLDIVEEPVRSLETNRIKPASLLDGLRVLLVEDDINILMATGILLEKWGCIVQREDGLPEGKDVTCDLIITDFDLGAKTTGTDCIDYVRRQNGHNIPAIVVTGHDENRVRDDVGDPEIPILSKPIRPAELRSIIMALKLKTEQQAVNV
ncbi:response regulator (plasmid) [Phyllobacterium sp. 628]|uniref:hybrid sensor histidine kinase/response regulator n=1 Tax=Phyllobacterium sp. 628 TaxID=2718938 RepID=UPI001662615F|nr:hybrid sensor histidine kinase/response regulator [Phyllobacterium sp. 628]QND54744.1 response regulator [Phyllobacterium sp. 628]